MTVRGEILHHYKRARAWQRQCANEDQGSLTVYPSGRTEFSWGGAPYQEHAISAYMSAKHWKYRFEELRNK